ncbi:MAG: HlyD family efflux transporter periplasmic adaptor subunit [Clostridiales bacterium]|jgi:HlyD family secretion protein|uniref:HlyD family secretion protein n=3 Tax=Aminipila sp. TaxID=2060095 RepID=UPI001D82775E|nr:efflux RND transporter periplasmic adaptor subunit [Aminipila sp.]MBE6034429.1 HlyD family efflux transporter periplasmic adaptor subunit [Clostridiales bacterium]
MEKEILTAVDKKKKTTAIFVGVLVVALIIAGCWSFSSKAEGNGDFIVQGSVKTTEIALNSKLAGNIGEILVKEGDQVKAGDVIIKISSEAVEAKLQQAQAAKAAAAATAQKAANGARSQEVAQAKAAFDYAQKTYDRMKTLLQEEAISQATFDQVEAQYIAAKETYNMALEGARSEDVAAAASLVAQADGAIAEVNSYLGDSQIKAPVDGTIIAINVNQGELISTGMPLATLSTNEEAWIEVNVKETDLNKVQQGQEVKVTFPAYPDKEWKGTVTVVNKKPDFATKRATNENGDFDVLSYGVKIAISGMDKELYSGMTAMVDFGRNEGK